MIDDQVLDLDWEIVERKQGDPLKHVYSIEVRHLVLGTVVFSTSVFGGGTVI